MYPNKNCYWQDTHNSKERLINTFDRLIFLLQSLNREHFRIHIEDVDMFVQGDIFLTPYAHVHHRICPSNK